MDNAENMVLALKALSWCKCTFKSEPGGLKERSSEMNTDRKSIRAYNNMIKDFPWLWAIMPIQHHEYTNIIVDYAEESIFNTSFLKNTTMSCDTWIKTSTEGRNSKVKQIEYFNDKIELLSQIHQAIEDFEILDYVVFCIKSRSNWVFPYESNILIYRPPKERSDDCYRDYIYGLFVKNKNASLVA